MKPSVLLQAEQLIRPDEAGQLLSLSRRTLRRYEVDGKLKAIKLNSRVTRYKLADVVQLTGGAR